MLLSSTNTASARDVQRNYRKVIDRVKKTKQPVIIISRNEPEVAIVTLEDYQRLQRKKLDWSFLNDVWERNKNLDPDEVYKEVTEEVEKVRQEMYEKEQKAARGR